MNAALDALWWRLTRPEVRDLASLLTMPPCWQSDCELSVRELLGETGFRYLIDLNNNLSFRLPERDNYPLLGKYAEALLAYWLSHAPHCRLLAQNIAIFNQQNQSIGELDFLAAINNKIYHIELACKYFGADNGQPENMLGLNPKDSLYNKINKLKSQLTILQNPATGQTLKQLGLNINIDTIQSVSITRGMLFTASGSLPTHENYAPNTWTGNWISSINQINHQINNDEKTWFYRLPKNAFLSPARISGSLKISAAECGQTDGLIAEVVERPDGYFHEIRRWMLCGHRG